MAAELHRSVCRVTIQMRRLRIPRSFGYQIMPSINVPDVWLSFGWADESTTVGEYTDLIWFCIYVVLETVCCNNPELHYSSCGKIFCSDCSEFFAALPEERLYNPVRLCGPCYLTVTQVNIYLDPLHVQGCC